ncbi:hypothetical protein HN51_062981 [Arachis hypogaea]
MSLLEVVKNASINSKPLNSPLDYPIVLNSNTIIPNLKPEQEDTAALCLVKPLSGWKISQADAELIDIGKKFFIQLKANLKSGNGLEKDEFISDLNSYLNSITKKIGISVAINPSMPNYTKFLIDKNIVEALIEHGVIKHSCDSDLVTRFVERKRSDLICSCIKHAFDLGRHGRTKNSWPLMELVIAIGTKRICLWQRRLQFCLW